MVNYPRVMTELETLAAAIRGRSLARYGDGELRICVGRQAISQRYHHELARELRGILKEATALACIPHMGTPNFARFWHKYNTPEFTLLYDHEQSYGSAFITRPDNAPWIDTVHYWDMVERLWLGRNVVLVHSGVKSFGDLMATALHVREVMCPARDAYDEIDRVEEEVGRPQHTVLICAGAMGTVLAERLACKGVHAIDCGHMGMFMRRFQEANK